MLVIVSVLALCAAWKIWRDHNEYTAQSVFDVIDKGQPVRLDSVIEKRRVWNLLCAVRNARLLISLCSHIECDTPEMEGVVADVRAEAYRVFFAASVGMLIAFLHLPSVVYSGYLKTHYQSLCAAASQLCLNVGGPIAMFENVLFS